MKLPVTIMLVDDDIYEREFFKEALKEIFDNRIELITARDGVYALEILNNPVQVLPDLLFLDINTPRMNGKELLVELQKNERLKNIPVVIYTLSSNPRDREEMLRNGALNYLVKPLSVKDLSLAIAGIINLDNQGEKS